MIKEIYDYKEGTKYEVMKKRSVWRDGYLISEISLAYDEGVGSDEAGSSLERRASVSRRSFSVWMSLARSASSC